MKNIHVIKNRSVFLLITFGFLFGCGTSNTGNTEEDVTNSSMVVESELFTQVEETEIDVSNLDAAQFTPEKKEVSLLENYNTFNQKVESRNNPSLFCVDETTGIIYFVNQNQDWYLYALKEGKAELAVAMPVREISCWDGKVYFMINNVGNYELRDMSAGDIFVYTPESGSVELVYAVGSLAVGLDIEQPELLVKESGIYFRCITEVEYSEQGGGKVQIKNFYLPFGAVEPLELEYDATLPGWGEYQLTCGKYFELQERTDVRKKKELGIETKNAAIMGDDLFYKDKWEIGILNLVTGKKQTYSVEKLMEEALELSERDKEMGLGMLSDFTVTEEYLWGMSNGKYLIRINRQTEEMDCYYIAGETQGLKKLYTDGKSVYGLYVNLLSEFSDDTGSVVKVLTDEVKTDENGFMKLPVINVKQLVK